jgi:hypothetical protein
VLEDLSKKSFKMVSVEFNRFINTIRKTRDFISSNQVKERRDDRDGAPREK